MNLSFLLSVAPLEIIKPPTYYSIFKLNQIHQSTASLHLSRSKVHGRLDPDREESGGEGVCPGPSPPTADFRVPSRRL